MKNKPTFMLSIITCLMMILILKTNAQIQLVKDISPGTINQVKNLTNVNGTLYFSANDGTNGWEPWKSDGTEVGTVMLQDIFPGTYDYDVGDTIYHIPNSSGAGGHSGFVNVNGTAYFTATDHEDIDGNEVYGLWKHDNTSGVTLLKSFPAQNQLFPVNGLVKNLANMNGILYFVGREVSNGYELWKSDGTTAGTTIVTDIFPGTSSSDPAGFTYLNGAVYFTATNGINGIELWKSDMATGATVIVKDINSGSSSSNPSVFQVMNGILYFRANDGTNGVELWKSDGSTAGTVMVKDINSGSNSSNPTFFEVINGSLYFRANDGINGNEFWKSDGTAGGTFLLNDLNPGLNPSDPLFLTNVNGTLYFGASYPTVALWKSDGTSAGTVMVKALPGYVNGTPTPDGAYRFKNANGILYFGVTVSSTYLWTSDGTSMGTVQHPNFYMDAGNVPIEIAGNNCFLGGIEPSNNIGVELYKLPLIGLTWTGAISNQWKIAGNWAPAQIPTMTDDVYIPASATVYPTSAATNACFDLTIEAGASLTMTGGSLSVYGTVTAPDVNCFHLQGGNLKLYHSQTFPDHMTFNNLTIYPNLVYPTDPVYNTYSIPGDVTVNGSLKILNGAYGYPKISMNNGDIWTVLKDITVTGGAIGKDDLDNLDPGIQGNLPVIYLWGSTLQTIKIPDFCDVDLNVQNPDINLQDDLFCANLFLHHPLDLKGRGLSVTGKIIYSDPSATITNSKPASGVIVIFNTYPYNGDYPVIRIADRIERLWLGGILSDPYKEDTFLLESNILLRELFCDDGQSLDMAGFNITVGKTTTSNGDVEQYSESYIINSVNNQGTLTLLGNASCPGYQLKATSLNNFTLNNPAGVELINSDAGMHLSITGTAKLTQGQFDVKDNFIHFEQPNGVAKETAGQTFYSTIISEPGYVHTYRTYNATSTNLNPGGIGFLITTNNPLGDISVQRFYLEESGLGSGHSILRTYHIINSANALNATIKLKYDDSELNGIPESNLRVFTSVDQQTWQMLPSTVNITTKYVTATGVQQIDFSGFGGTYYTLGDVNNQLRLENSSIESEQTPTETDGMLLYPNPATDHLEINLECGSGISDLQIFNLLGKLVMSKTIHANENEKCHEELDISKLPQGVYLVKAAGTEGMKVRKFVKH